jgi:hypothetical protein
MPDPADDEIIPPTKDPPEIVFDYIKASDFRVVWADGVIGAITPSGMLHFALYAERQAIPRRQVFTLEQIDGGRGKLGSEILAKQEARGSIVREMSCDVFMTPETAENFAQWLLNQVNEIKKLRGQGT